MNTAVPTNYTRVFELLAYASLAVDVVSVIVQDREMDTIIYICAVGLILAALIWATARRGYSWAAGLLVVWFAYSLGYDLSERWAGAPEWLHSLFPPSGKGYVRLMSAVSLALLGAALLTYFTKVTKTPTLQA